MQLLRLISDSEYRLDTDTHYKPESTKATKKRAVLLKHTLPSQPPQLASTLIAILLTEAREISWLVHES